MQLVPGQLVTAVGFPTMTLKSINGNSAVCEYLETSTGHYRDVELLASQVFPVNPSLPAAFSPGVPISIESLYTIAGLPQQSVVSGPSDPAFQFTYSGGLAGASFNLTLIRLIANGLSPLPTVTGMTGWGVPAYSNIAGAPNDLIVFSDGFDIFYYWSPYEPIPTPVAFNAAAGGSTLTVGIGGLTTPGPLSPPVGLTLGPVTPPLSAFALIATRNGQPAPYYLSSINTIHSGDNQLVLNVAGGTFAAGDVVQLSYSLPASNPLQDPTKLNKVAPWLSAVVTVQ